jgi:hypothetical protein
MAEEKFKLPQSSYEELVKIIKAYGNLTKPANLETVSKLLGIHITIISRNAGFLTAVGILESGAKKFLTPEGMELAKALEHGVTDQIRDWWRKIVLSNVFLKKLLTAIKIRGGMDEASLETHIAYSAGQPKKKQFMTGARAIVDILQTAELINELDGKLISTVSDTPSEIESNLLETDKPKSEKIDTKPHREIIQTVQPTPNIQINIRVDISCTLSEIDVLGEKLKSLMKELKSSEPSSAKDA